MKLFFFAALLVLAGCGSSGSMVTVRGGVEVSQTDWFVGYRDSSSRDATVGRYERCMAELGGLPDREMVCKERILEELRLQQETLRCTTGCYDPYGFRQYVPQPR